MKLLLISTLYPTKDHPDYGTYVKAIHQAYLDQGMEVDLVTFMREGGKLKKALEMRRFKSALKDALERASDYDVINVQYPYFAAPIIRKKLYQLRTPIVTSVHGSDVFADSAYKEKQLEDTAVLMANSHRVITPSEFFKKKLLENYLLEPTRVTSCPPGGFDGSAYSGTRRASETLRISVVGRLVLEKGLPTVFKALSELKDELPSYELRIVGGGEDESVLKSLAEKEQVSAVFTGAVSPKELPVIYESTDLFIFPTELEESLGMVGLEAMYGGAFVIASEIGAIPEYLENQVEGLLFKPGDVSSLKEAIISYLGLSEEDKHAMIERAKMKASSYEKSQVARELYDLMKRVQREETL